MSSFKFSIKVFSFILFSVEIDMNNKKDESLSEVKTFTSKKVEPSLSSVPDNRTNNPNYRGAVKQDLKEIEQQLNPVEKIEPKLIKCTSCEGTTYDDDIRICSVCKKEVCSICGSYDSTSKKHYCNTCWLEI